jgi:FkbM family methyltransferase
VATDPYAVVCYSQEGEDRILERIFESTRRGTYVDVGAHHPRRFSNTHLLYQQGWSGLNVDPLPGSAQLFRRERKRDISIECGVGLVQTIATFTEFVEPALSTFDPVVAQLRKREGHAIAAVHEIPVVPLRDLIAKHLPGRSIDLLTVDVEGSDLDVLRSADLGAWRPHVLCVESYVTDLHARTEIDEFVLAFDYTLVAGTGYSRIYRLSDRSRPTT